MKITSPRDPFVTALQHAGRAVSARSTLPSLGGILFTADGDSLTLRATDMEMGIALALDGVQVEREGTVLLPGRLLVDVARSLPAGDVSLELRSEQRDVELTAGDARFHLKTLPAEDFPRLPEVEGEAATLPAAPLAETIERVARAASRDEVRPILTGVLVQADGPQLTMVATDSYRLSVKHTALETPLEQPLDANVPARALRELARLVASDTPETVDIDVSRNQAIFRIDGDRALLAPDRGAVPELAAADPGVVRARGAAAARGAARGRAPREPARAAKRAASASRSPRASSRSRRRPRTSATRPSRCRLRSPASRSRSRSTRST